MLALYVRSQGRVIEKFILRMTVTFKGCRVGKRAGGAVGNGSEEATPTNRMATTDPRHLRGSGETILRRLTATSEWTISN
jgi:hypothetical protein